MKLSPAMQEAIDKARAGDGKLYRHPGGFWTYLPPNPEITENTFSRMRHGDNALWSTGTHTIKALLKRVAAIETGWANSGGGTFCVQITIQ